MNLGTRLTALASVSRDAVSGAATRLTRRLRGRTADHPERGDVPGWVMITFLTGIYSHPRKVGLRQAPGHAATNVRDLIDHWPVSRFSASSNVVKGVRGFVPMRAWTCQTSASVFGPRPRGARRSSIHHCRRSYQRSGLGAHMPGVVIDEDV